MVFSSVLVPVLWLVAEPCDVKGAVNVAVDRIRAEHGVPGMAVAVTVDGRVSFFNFGVASKESGRAVTEETIFEVGSISKVFTGTLVAYAESLGKLRLGDAVSRHVPELAGSGFDRVRLLDVATYTAGGLPLQFPDEVTNLEQMFTYYRNWRPEFEAGRYRRYSNPSIGLAGYAAARSLKEPFDGLMEKKLFPMLGLTGTYIQVPAGRMGDYAHGYTADGRQVRVNPGVLASEAYGVKTSSRDLARFLERVMNPGSVKDAALRKAMEQTRRGYCRVGGMTQGLGWEMYGWPAGLEVLLAGNSPEMAMKPNAARALAPPAAMGEGVWLNKTGSTNGFGGYVVVVPGRRLGVVILANKNYPNAARVRAGFEIVSAVEGCAGR